MIYCNNCNSVYEYSCRKIFDNVQKIDESHYNKDIWAFAYKEDERALNLMCKPVKGRIKEDDYFYEYKVNGKDLKKNGVSIYARSFTDTYEEAVEGFNKLVRTRIESLKDEISKLEDMLVIENNTI